MSDSAPINGVPKHFATEEEIDEAKRALRALLDSFRLGDEVELPKALTDPIIQKRMAKMITMCARPRESFLKLVRTR